MLKELQLVHNKFIAIMKEEKGVLGAWNFGSASHDMTDEFSDIDIVFLIDGDNFQVIDDNLTKMLKSICDDVIICWPEDFNSDAVKNYGYLLQLNEQIFQYDIFLLNNAYIDDFMCQMHYTDLQKKDVVFDIDDNVSRLIAKAPSGNLWCDDIPSIIKTYWFHVHMSAKYFARKDFFKLNNVLRILMDTHTALLLTAYDKITWGGSANKLAFIDEDKQQHLMKYGCIPDFFQMKENLLQSITWFENDIKEIGNADEAAYSQKTGNIVMKHFYV